MKTNVLRLALVQANPVVGDIAGNLRKIKEFVSCNHDVDIVVFPECFLSGYPLEDLVLRPRFLSEVDEALTDLAHWVRENEHPAVLVGAPMAGVDLPYNAAHLIDSSGGIRTVVKLELPNTDVFDEHRIFSRGDVARPLTFRGWRIGAMICEDMWHGRVTAALAGELVDFLLVINGSPFEIGKTSLRLAHARERVRQAGVPLVYLNMVGGQDELVFDGNSFVVDAGGSVVAGMPGFHESVEKITLSRSQSGAIEIEADAGRFHNGPPLSSEEEIYTACVMGLRDYVEKSGFNQVLLGVSGGLDSALVAAMAVDALGADNVLGVMMPTEFTGNDSIELADDLFLRLGCKKDSLPIGSIFESFKAALGQHLSRGGRALGEEALGLALENLQPRARGALLMGISNACGGLVLSTGNKSEMSVGYATLYGDMCGGFNPIKDLYKTVAFQVCRWRNANHRSWMKGPAEPIPEGIISRPPTAELKPGQTDEGALGSYDVLDEVLRLLIEDLCDVGEASRLASRSLGREVPEAYVRRIAGLVRRAEYKRRQAPPGIKLTGRSFGKGWRYPITNKAEF